MTNPEYGPVSEFIRNPLVQKVGAVVATIGILGGAAYAQYGPEAMGADRPTLGADDSGQSPEDIRDGIVEALTVRTTSLDCVEVAERTDVATTYERSQDEKGVRFDVGAVKPVTSGNPAVTEVRLWSDAISTPYKSTEAQPANTWLAETQATLCEDPEMGSTLGHMFAKMEVGGVSVLELNPWLKKFDVEEGKINDVAEGYMPLRDKDAPSDQMIKGAIKQSREYEAVAEKLGTMLERFKATGVKQGKTAFNYHLTAGGAVVGGLPEVSLNPSQYDAKAFRLVLDQKTGECLIEIGFNVGDKRPEQFEICDVPRITTPTTEGDTPDNTKPRRGGTTTSVPHRVTTTTSTFPDKVLHPTPGPGTPGTTQPAPQGPPGGSPTTSTTRVPITITTSTTVRPNLPPTTVTSQPNLPPG